jgi:hypothetical protein
MSRAIHLLPLWAFAACSRVSFTSTSMSEGVYVAECCCVLLMVLGLCFILWKVCKIITVNSLLERRVFLVKFEVRCQGRQGYERSGR